MITVDGKSLTIAEIKDAILSKKRVRVAPSALRMVCIAAKTLHAAAGKKIIYGVNTGFGPMASRIIGNGELTALQYNLVRSHAVGMGEPIAPRFVAAAMFVRLNTLAKGFSGVSEELLHALEVCINQQIVPLVPEHGAVGTSGDLVQLAHIALALIGEGEVWYKGKRQLSREVLKRLHIAPYMLKPKEGLSLINGTSMMTGIGVWNVEGAERLTHYALLAGALALELVHGFDDSISEALQAVRPHPGQRQAAETLRNILSSSRSLRSRKTFESTHESEREIYEIPELVQEIYSLRCIPQIIGPVLETIAHTKNTVEIEMNAATDNPLIIRGNFLHGGNFHGDVVSHAMDDLKIVITKLTLLMERQINFFLNRNVNKFFPQFLNLKTPGLTLGLQGLQFVATSTAAQSQTLSFPQYIHSISTNADNQDVVSMGTDAALLTHRVIENAWIVLAIELVTLAQAVDFLHVGRKLSRETRKLYALVRRYVPTIREDMSISRQLNALANALSHEATHSYI